MSAVSNVIYNFYDIVKSTSAVSRQLERSWIATAVQRKKRNGPHEKCADVPSPLLTSNPSKIFYVAQHFGNREFFEMFI